MMKRYSWSGVALLLMTLFLAASTAIAQTSPATVLVTGANRGLGLEWVRRYAKRGDIVIATARNPAEAKALQTLARETGRVRIESVEATDAASVDAVAVLSPGVVNTYGTPDDHDAMSPEMRASMTTLETSVGGVIKVLDGLTVEGSGRWHRFSGEVIAW